MSPSVEAACLAGRALKVQSCVGVCDSGLATHCVLCLFGTRSLQILNTGVRVFARVQAGDRLIFRLAEEGLARVLPFVTQRTLDASDADVARMLSPPTSANGQAHAIESFSAAFQAHVTHMRALSGVGPALLVPTTATKAIAALPVWLGDKSVVLLADKSTQRRLATSFVQATAQ